MDSTVLTNMAVSAATKMISHKSHSPLIDPLQDQRGGECGDEAAHEHCPKGARRVRGDPR